VPAGVGASDAGSCVPDLAPCLVPRRFPAPRASGRSSVLAPRTPAPASTISHHASIYVSTNLRPTSPSSRTTPAPRRANPRACPRCPRLPFGRTGALPSPCLRFKPIHKLHAKWHYSRDSKVCQMRNVDARPRHHCPSPASPCLPIETEHSGSSPCTAQRRVVFSDAGSGFCQYSTLPMF